MTDSTIIDSSEVNPDLTHAAAELETNPTSDSSTAQGGSKIKRLIKKAGWVFLGFYCLVFFTLLKLPEDRVRNYIQGYIAYELSSQGVSFSAEKSSLSFALGVRYTMKDVTLTFTGGQDPVKIAEVSVSPSLFSLLLGKLGATVHMENKGGTLDAFYKQSLKGVDGKIGFNFSAKNLDLGSLGIMPLAFGFKGSALLSGDGNFSGSLANPTSLEGDIDLNVTKLKIDQQTIMGFTVPQLAISQSKMGLSIEGGKATFKTFQVGQPGSTTDDLKGSITGDMTLGKVISYSTLNLKTSFNLSQNVLKSFVLLDALLGNAKNTDGSYSYTITGNLSAPNFQATGNNPPGSSAGVAPSAPTPSAGEKH